MRNFQGKLTIITFNLLLFLSFQGFGQSLSYSRMKVWFDGKSPLKLAELGIDMNEGETDTAGAFTSDFSNIEIDLIKEAGFRTEILIKDVSEYYKLQNLNSGTDSEDLAPPLRELECNAKNRIFEIPSRFRYGSMGGYLTLNELMQVLDSMKLAYPQLISIRKTIDTIRTHQNRQIYFVKISDNPEADEDEPAVLYSALHHAREPISMMQMVCYMWYLLENYERDKVIQNVVNHTELYFIPCLNPDGYEYNRSISPKGGGMWRKNRRQNSSTGFGVDLNRNYPFKWGYDNFGSSSNTSSDVYRGPSPASEPEIKAMISFCKQHRFVLANNYHTYTNVHIIPWGYINTDCPDSAVFSRYARQLTAENNFTIGRSVGTVGYPVNGNSDDWMYGETKDKPSIVAMTPEVGDAPDGFWPAQTKIFPFCRKQLHSNLMLGLLAGRYGLFSHYDSAYAHKGIIPVPIRFDQTGLDRSGNYTVTFTPLSLTISSTSQKISFKAPALFSSYSDTLYYTLSEKANPLDEVSYSIELHNGLFTMQSDTITRLIGRYELQDFSSQKDWAGSGWNISSSVFSPESPVYTDSPNGNYISNANQTIILKQTVDLSNAVDAVLSFYARWYLEFGTDYVQIEASDDNGQSWKALCGKYSRPGSGSFQPSGAPLFSGLQEEWIKEEVSLNNFLGSKLLLRFRISTNSSINRDGFYFTDAYVQTLHADITSVNYLAKEDNVFTVSPNPANHSAMIYARLFEKESHFEILDISGKCIYAKYLSGNPTGTIQLPDISAGIYLLKLADNNNKIHYSKLIVAK